MQSQQEDVLEEFMQRSFGAQFLYVPCKYKKGAAHREPADLAWVDDDFIVLFYLMSSSGSLAAQIKHNRKQAEGYHRMWETRKPLYALRGKNRFGDECFATYDSKPIKMAALVVSSPCAPHFLSPLKSAGENIVLVVPEQLIHWVAEFGGTIVDLLYLVHVFLEQYGHLSPDSEQAVVVFAELVQAYVQYARGKADPERRYLSGQTQMDYSLISDYLSLTKVSDRSGFHGQSRQAREQLGRLFGDLMLAEFASIAIAAEAAIQQSEPPDFKKWVVIKIEGSYYKFVVATINLGASNHAEAMAAATQACQTESGGSDCILFLYGNVLDANDYRCPILSGMPTVLPVKHSLKLMQGILEMSRGHGAES